jgi:Cu(I)/Ag(I) efflux system membrane protein CusA/SilA
VVLIAIAGALAGASCAVHTPMDAVPDLSENQVIVISSWPGHGPREIEEQITYPLSLQLQGLEGVRVVRGSSDIGYSMLHVIFDDHVTFTTARLRVQERLGAQGVSLPEGVVPHLAPDGIPTGQIYWYTVEGTGYDLSELRSLQDWTIGPQLSSVAGVAEVASVGGFVPELLIQVDLASLLANGLTPGDLADELSRPTTSVGGHVIHKGNAEFVVQLNAVRGSDTEVDQWTQRRIPLSSGESLRLGDVAQVAWGPAVRRGVFEKDGNEVVAGIVHLRYGHNTLEVTKNVRSKLREVASGLPEGVRIVPCYDRTPLITGAVGTVTRALIEALLVAAVCVLLVLRHFRAWLVIALSLPLSVLGTFLCMWVLRKVGLVDVQTNIMSLAGIVISIGVLIDSSIVMTENVMHRLRQQFGDNPITGDVTEVIASACTTVGWPVFCSIIVMLVSFAPVFALEGIDGRMYRPLAWTKSLALISTALLSVTLVPALCTLLVRGRIRDESDSTIVRSVVAVYRPMLSWLIDRPAPLIFLLCATLVLASIPLGNELVFRGTLFLALTVILHGTISSRNLLSKIGPSLLIVVIALIGQKFMKPLGIEMRMPLDEGMVMDMPITIPRASITQTVDDLKARNMMMCRFPEVLMVTGKGGRAETPFDPAPLDMIESMIEFRPKELWPRRRLTAADSERMTHRLVQELMAAGLVGPISEDEIHEMLDGLRFRFDTIQRETAWQLTEVFRLRLQQDLARFLIERMGQELSSRRQLARPLQPSDVASILNDLPVSETRELAVSPSQESITVLWPQIVSAMDRSGTGVTESNPADGFGWGKLRSMGRTLGFESSTPESRVVATIQREHRKRWRAHVSELDRTLHQRAAPTWIRLACYECFDRGKIIDERLKQVYEQIGASRTFVPEAHDEESHHELPSLSELPLIDPYPKYDGICRRLTDEFTRSLILWQHDSSTLAAFGGEMDRVLQMPGWTNVWTRPIQNRVDMLATGVNAEVGIRVLGRQLDDVVTASEEIAAVLKDVPGAADVVADPVRGKGLIEIIPDFQRASKLGVSLADLQSVLETALSGRVIGQILDGRERKLVRMKLGSSSVEVDEQTLRRLPVPRRRELGDRASTMEARPGTEFVAVNPVSQAAPTPFESLPLDAIADVQVMEGPATIKSENGWLRNYVRLNVRDRNPFELVEEAKRVVAKRVTLPHGVFLEWTGQFEHAETTRQTLLFLGPAVLLIIFGMLYITYRDWTDASLMLISAPGALAGGILCQWLLGYRFSIAVGVGYIACFGMAAATGIVMLVYLREAVDARGGLERLSLSELKEAVLNGAVHRLRPKLLTEATTILGLAPMLWSEGIGAEVIRPMAAPVLGGILIADEVIDLLLPVLFYHVRRHRWHRLHRLR